MLGVFGKKLLDGGQWELLVLVAVRSLLATTPCLSFRLLTAHYPLRFPIWAGRTHS